jgi:hypothetical protein
MLADLLYTPNVPRLQLWNWKPLSFSTIIFHILTLVFETPEAKTVFWDKNQEKTDNVIPRLFSICSISILPPSSWRKIDTNLSWQKLSDMILFSKENRWKQKCYFFCRAKIALQSYCYALFQLIISSQIILNFWSPCLEINSSVKSSKVNHPKLVLARLKQKY